MGVSVVTRSYDFERSGVNRQETALTAPAVAKRGIKKLFTLSTPDDARGCEASPLIASGVKMPDGKVRDVILLSTMGNWIYAFDEHHGTLLWKRRLGIPIRGTKAIDNYLINQFWGILST